MLSQHLILEILKLRAGVYQLVIFAELFASNLLLCLCTRQPQRDVI